MRLNFVLSGLIIILVSISGLAQDEKNPEMEAFYLNQSDSLFETGQYEDAFYSLYKSREYLGDLSQSAIEDSVYLFRFNRLDSVIEEITTVNGFYDIRIYKANYAVSAGDIDRALHWLNEVKNSFPNQSLPDEMRNRILLNLRTDTIPYQWSKPYSLYRDDRKDWRLVKDSSLFNGVWLHKVKTHTDYKYSIRYDNYRKGNLTGNRIETYCKSKYSLSQDKLKKQYGLDYPVYLICGESFTRNDTLITYKFDVEGKIYDWRKEYENDTIYYGSTYTLETEQSAFSHNETFSSKWDGNNSNSAYFEYNEAGDTILWEIVSNSGETEHQFFLSKEDGDTTSYMRVLNNEIYGYNIDGFPIENIDYEIIGWQFIRTIWENGIISDVLNTDIIYVDKKIKIIDEAEYLNKITYKIDNDFLALQLPPENVDYHFIVYSDRQLFNRLKVKKLLKKRRRMDKKMN